MKKLYSLITLALLFVSVSNSNATIHTFSVASFQFSPTSVAVNVGDTVAFVWTSGSHTTTSTSVPAGASTWDAPMNSSNPGFIYVVTVAGTYNFHCSIHPSMVGSFVATSSSGIINPGSIAEGLSVNSVNDQSMLNVTYNLNRMASVRLTLFDLTGKAAKVILSTTNQTAGSYSDLFSVSELQTGIYIFELIAGNERYTKRVIIQ